MENEIKVGEYIRSDLGSIGKVTRIEDNTTTKFFYEDKELITIDKRVVKHSPNLIDIIEERRLCKWRTNNRYLEWK